MPNSEVKLWDWRQKSGRTNLVQSPYCTYVLDLVWSSYRLVVGLNEYQILLSMTHVNKHRCKYDVIIKNIDRYTRLQIRAWT
jgi:hypothetical protein